MRSFYRLGCAVACIVTLTAPSILLASPSEWRWAVGAQIDPASHVIIDLGYRQRGFSAQLLTDTFDLRYRHRLERGEWQFGARLALFGAELLFSPWENNEPAPEQALRAGYLGADISRSWWFSKGLYLGLSSELRQYRFGQWRDATRAVPSDTLRARTGLKMGFWRSDLRTEILIGHIVERGHQGAWTEARFELPPAPGWWIANGTYLGWSQGLSRLSRFRLGGLNPYVVPFAGLGWAQHWVQRYVVQRLGVAYSATTTPFDATLGFDVGAWDRALLQVSAVAMSRFEADVYQCAVMGGMTVYRDGRTDVGHWSLFFLFERPWG